MKETIKFYYNVYPEKIYEIDNGYYFYLNDIKYYFIKYERDINETNFLIDITNKLYKRNVLVDTFIKNKDGNFVININNENYVLLRVNSIENDIYNLKDIMYFNNLLISTNNYNISNNWSNLWKKKVDDIENEFNDLNNEYPLLRMSIDYYVGLAENAISYFNDTLIEEDVTSVKINLNHKRIPSITYSGFINNPLNFTLDYEVRDFAEYLKSHFFSNDIDYDYVYEVLTTNIFNKASLRILFARLLYPSYYFDLVKNIFEGNNEEKDVIKYLNRINDYQMFLQDIYNIISKKYSIPVVEWINNV